MMATETKAATEEVKVDLFEDDDEFEEFEINEGMTCSYLSSIFHNTIVFHWHSVFIYACPAISSLFHPKNVEVK